MTGGYAERFARAADAEAYDRREYAEGSYASFIWALQRPQLRRLVSSAGVGAAPPTLLDFACGTGRILSEVETLVGECHGVDLSSEMVRLAGTRCVRASLHVGDLLADERLLPGPFDAITAFRILLNVEPALRDRILAALRRRLRPGGLLVANVHGNARSARHPAIAWKRALRRLRGGQARPGEILEELDPAEALRLFERAGLEVVEQLGFGLLPPTLHRTPLAPLARGLDAWAAARPWARRTSIDLVFACRAH